jgi:hypothetical protein
MTAGSDQIETRSKKGRGMAQKSIELIDAMYAAAEIAHPITGRGIGYKLFVRRTAHGVEALAVDHRRIGLFATEKEAADRLAAEHKGALA